MELSVLLSRIQTGLSIGIHFIFPSLTLGLVFYLFLMETFHVATGKEIFKNISSFTTKILALVFAFGVATGIILPFTFGTNWAEFSRFAGPLFGTNLAVEGIVAFTLESVFLGVLLFGRGKVSKGFYLFSTFAVFFGSHLSALIILATDSWMQTPFHTAASMTEWLQTGRVDPVVNGFTIETLADGTKRIVLTDFFKAFFNPSTGIRFVHTINAAWLTGAIFVMGIAAWFLLKKRETESARKMFGTAAVIALVTAFLQPVWGHTHIMTVTEWQGPKGPAMEGLFETQKGAPLYSFGILDEENQKVHGLGIPYALSYLETFDFNAEVKGLNEYPKESWPPLQIVFHSFRFMVFIGFFLMGLTFFAVLFHYRGTLERKPRLLKLIFFSIPLPILANEFGWISAEVGRQPWTIWQILPTAKAASTVPAEYVMFSLAVLSLIYIVLLVLFFRFLPGIIQHGIVEKGA